MRFLKMAVIVGAALAATAGTTIVASAYPTPKDHQSVDCDPGHVSATNGSCSVVFVDTEPTTTTPTAASASLAGKAGQTVCFTVDGPGAVTPACGTTNSKGKVFATYHAGTSVECGGKDPDGKNAVIRAKESADDHGSSQTTVRVTCPDTGKKPHKDAAAASTSSSLHGSTTGSSHGSTTNARNTAALISAPTTSPGGLALGGGILALIVILSVAITGRLRMRGLRR